MRLTEGEKRSIAARAETLTERIDAGHSAAEGDPDFAQTLLDEWREIFSSDYTILERRFRQLGIDRDDLPSYVAFAEWPEEEPLPEWVTYVDRALSFASEFDPDDVPDRYADSDVPFVHALYPLVRFAFEQEPIETGRLPDPAIDDFRFWLLQRLSGLTAQALDVEFRIFKRQDTTEEEREFSDRSTKLYDAYVSELLDGRFRSVIHHYPVLGRYIAVLCDNSANFCAEFVDRLTADREALIEAFGDAASAPVESVELGKGDPHHDARTVVQVVFESDLTLFYKPRDVSPEALLRELVTELDSAGSLELSIEFPYVVEREGYGWIENVSRRETVHEEVGQYYRRIGYLLALLYVLNASDVHYENLIACGDVPVVVDAETILTRSVVQRHYLASEFHRTVLQHEIRESVFGTMMLPFLSTSEGGGSQETVTVSAIGRIEAAESPGETIVWNQVNTDAMTFEITTIEFEPSSNFPLVDGEAVWPDPHLDDIVSGFEAMYRELRKVDVASRLERSPTAAKTRYLFRPTSVYSGAINSIIVPSRLRNGVNVELELDRLLPDVQLLTPEGIDLFQPVIDAERSALVNLDVPRFTISGTDLRFRSDTIAADFFELDNADVLERNVANLGAENRRKQVAYIRAAVSDESATKQLHEAYHE